VIAGKSCDLGKFYVDEISKVSKLKVPNYVQTTIGMCDQAILPLSKID